MDKERREAIELSQRIAIAYHRKVISEYEDIKRIARIVNERNAAQSHRRMAH